MRIVLCSALLLSLSLVPSAALRADDSHDHQPPKVSAEVDGAKVYGEVLPAPASTTAIGDALRAPDQFLGKSIAYTGRIGKVCQKAGCWMSLLEGEQQVRVVFGDHAFSIPADSAGTATVWGTLEQVTLSEAKAKHLAEDAGADPAQVSGEQVEYRVVARSVAIRS